MKHLLFLSVFCFVFVCFTVESGWSAEAKDQPIVKIGYINLQKALQETSAGQKAKKQIETAFNSKKKELEEKENDLKKMSQDLEKKKAVLSQEVFNRKQAELQTEMLKYRELVGKSQMEIQKQDRELTQPILEKLQKVIETVAKEEGYSMVLEKAEQNVIWAKADLDLTDKVVKAYEKSNPKSK